MTGLPVLRHLETARLVLRPRLEGEASVYRQLRVERDPRVPARRRIDADGRPTVEDVAAQLRDEARSTGLTVRAIELRGTSEVVGCCGLAVDGRAPTCGTGTPPRAGRSPRWASPRSSARTPGPPG